MWRFLARRPAPPPEPRRLAAADVDAAFEHALAEERRAYDSARAQVSKLLFLETRLDAEVRERRADLARLHAAQRRCAHAAPARSIEVRREALFAEVAALERDLASIRSDSGSAKRILTTLADKLRDTRRERDTALARLSVHEARRTFAELASALPHDGASTASQLAELRAELDRLDAEHHLDLELAGGG